LLDEEQAHSLLITPKRRSFDADGKTQDAAPPSPEIHEVLTRIGVDSNEVKVLRRILPLKDGALGANGAVEEEVEERHIGPIGHDRTIADRCEGHREAAAVAQSRPSRDLLFAGKSQREGGQDRRLGNQGKTRSPFFLPPLPQEDHAIGSLPKASLSLSFVVAARVGR
jgi:hypothetical protein